MRRVDSLEKTLILEGIGGRGEGDDRGWDGWMASPTRWAWIWVNSGSSWWTGRPGMLRFMGSQRVRHDWATELNWTELKTATLSPNEFHHSEEKPPPPIAPGGLPYLERSLRRLRTSWRASFPAAWLPQHSVARARWFVRRLDTWRARPECTASVEPPSEFKQEKVRWKPQESMVSLQLWRVCTKASVCPIFL